MSANSGILAEESYWSRLGRRFWADRFARTALITMILLYVVAALAPFLANDHAIVRVADGRLSFPVFASLEPIEWRYLAYVPLVGLIYFFRHALGRHPGRGLLLVLVAIAAVEITLALTHPVNDTSNDRQRPAAFKIMPPIPYSPLESSSDQFYPPSWKHLCGTDSTGRDVAARMLHGARTSLSVGSISQAIALAVGTLLGGLAGHYRGWLDIFVSRCVEIMDCFPSLLLILVIVGLLGGQNNGMVIIVVLGLTRWTGTARLVRAEFLRLGVQPFTLAAVAVGARDMRVLWRHLLPNALGPILVVTTFGVASAVLTESSLSFLGFGIQAPTPSWGDTLDEARRFIDFAWWLAFFPGVAILITVMSYNFVGEGLRDAVDPKLNVTRSVK